VALGPNSGAAVERFGLESGDQRPRCRPGELCCDVDGFSLQAEVRIAADDREGLERVCRCVTRSPIQIERLSLDFLTAVRGGIPRARTRGVLALRCADRGLPPSA